MTDCKKYLLIPNVTTANFGINLSILNAYSLINYKSVKMTAMSFMSK